MNSHTHLSISGLLSLYSCIATIWTRPINMGPVPPPPSISASSASAPDAEGEGDAGVSWRYVVWKCGRACDK